MLATARASDADHDEERASEQRDLLGARLATLFGEAMLRQPRPRQKGQKALKERGSVHGSSRHASAKSQGASRATLLRQVRLLLTASGCC